MLNPEIAKPEIVALLSTNTLTGKAQGAADRPAILSVGGEPMLAGQIAALRNHGVSRFLLEVDNVSGALLAVADRLRATGCQIEFVRTAQDLRKMMKLDERLLVQIEGLFLSSELLTGILAEPTPFVATVDGRDENAVFERMDLNTRWAGLALLGAEIVASLEALPEGWSISSSLLRHAMQARVRLLPLPQSHLQHGDLRLVADEAEAEQLSRLILANRGKRRSGFIESRIFGPVAARLAPLIWKYPSGKRLTMAAMLGVAAGSVACAVMGQGIAATALALLGIFTNCLSGTISDPAQDRGAEKFGSPLFWALLAAATVSAAVGDVSYFGDGYYAALVLVGILLLSDHLALPAWAQNILKSPALNAGLLLVAVPFAGFVDAVQWLSLVQMAMLVVAKWSPGP